MLMHHDSSLYTESHQGVFNTHKTVKIRSLKHYSKDDFILKLKTADWNVFYNSTCVNTAWTHFNLFIYFFFFFWSSLDTVAPIKEIRLKIELNHG